jgi:hypothetical protein
MTEVPLTFFKVGVTGGKGLDYFIRNLFEDTTRSFMFANDALALPERYGEALTIIKAMKKRDPSVMVRTPEGMVSAKALGERLERQGVTAVHADRSGVLFDPHDPVRGAAGRFADATVGNLGKVVGKLNKAEEDLHRIATYLDEWHAGGNWYECALKSRLTHYVYSEVPQVWRPLIFAFPFVAWTLKNTPAITKVLMKDPELLRILLAPKMLPGRQYVADDQRPQDMPRMKKVHGRPTSVYTETAEMPFSAIRGSDAASVKVYDDILGGVTYSIPLPLPTDSMLPWFVDPLETFGGQFAGPYFDAKKTRDDDETVIAAIGRSVVESAPLVTNFVKMVEAAGEWGHGRMDDVTFGARFADFARTMFGARIRVSIDLVEKAKKVPGARRELLEWIELGKQLKNARVAQMIEHRHAVESGLFGGQQTPGMVENIHARETYGGEQLYERTSLEDINQQYNTPGPSPQKVMP